MSVFFRMFSAYQAEKNTYLILVHIKLIKMNILILLPDTIVNQMPFVKMLILANPCKAVLTL